MPYPPFSIPTLLHTMNLRQQFYRPDHDVLSRRQLAALTALRKGRSFAEQVMRDELAARTRRERRIARCIATAVAKAHCKLHGTPSDVSFEKRRKPAVVVVVVKADDLFA